MIFKLRTSQKTMKFFDAIGTKENLQPFALAKIAISLSLNEKKSLVEENFNTDNSGLELNRQTITGEFDLLFKCLVELYEGRHLKDEEYFPKFLKAHLDRGAEILYSEFRYNSDFIKALLSDKQSI